MNAKQFNEISQKRLPGVSLDLLSITGSELYIKAELPKLPGKVKGSAQTLCESIAAVFIAEDSNLTAVIVNGHKYMAFF